MKRLHNKGINQVNIISIAFSAILTVIFTIVVITNTYFEYKEEIKVIEDNYYTSQQAFVKKETTRALNFITYKHKNNKNSIEDLKGEIVDAIEHMRDKRDGSGYIFIYTFDGVNIADPIQKQNGGKNLIDFQDSNGKKVIKELIEVSQKPSGGFVEYVWNKPTTNKIAPKISYAKAYKPLGWMVGSGVYLDDIEIVLEEKKQEYNNKVSKYTIQILSLAFILFFTGMGIYRYFTYIISKDINTIRTALSQHKLIDTDKITFKEFVKTTGYINLMNEELQDLNKNLENKVYERTKELQESREYAENLVKAQDKFIKNAIHEINTPLSIIITNIDLFKMKVGGNKYLSKIEAGSKVIHNIYNDLTYMIKKDRVKYTKEKLNFSEFLKQRVDFFSEVATGYNLILKSQIAEDLYVFFNETELQRICDNNISNATKYSFSNTEILISLKQKEDNVVFEITNSGENIEDFHKVFERYYRENDASGGFGIGLNMIKEICDKNNVIVELQSKNNVTTFKYKFKREKIEITTT